MIRPIFAGAGLFLTTMLLAVVALCAAMAGGAFAAHTRAADIRTNSALTVRVLSPATPQGIATATRVLRGTPGVVSAEPMSAARAAQLLAQWGGATVDPADLPSLHLIEVRRDAGADSRIESYLRGAGLRAELYGAGPADAGVTLIADLATNAAILAVVAILLVIALVFAAAAHARGAAAALAAELGGGRGESLASCGCSAGEFAFLAGLAAAIACTVGAPGVITMAGETLSLQDMVARISSMEATLVLLAPLLTAAAAALGARAGAARAYDRADRLR